VTAGQVHITDLRADQCILRPDQWTPHLRRDPAAMRGVALHQWDTLVGTEGRLRLRYGGEAEALGRRAAKAPYTISCGVGRLTGVPVVALAHPPERYTYASDSACGEYLAVGVMGAFPFEEAARKPHHTEVTDAMQVAVDRALAEAVAMLQGPGPWALITHRQAVNGRGDHVNCPGEAVVMMALRSSAVRDGLLVPDPDHVILPAFGKAWPGSWRRHLSEQVALRGVDDGHGALEGNVGPASPV